MPVTRMTRQGVPHQTRPKFSGGSGLRMILSCLDSCKHVVDKCLVCWFE